jgi:transcriptional regulator with XRE-family HTH domain
MVTNIRNNPGMSRKKLLNLGTFIGIAGRIVEVRKKLNLSQEEFGKLVGVRKSTISRYESGTIPGDENLRRIAEIGNTTIDWLLRGDRVLTPQPSEHPQYAYDRERAPLDVALLSEVLTEINNFIADKGSKLLPQREARLVALVYDHCQKDKVKPDPNLVERFLWITRVD